MSLVWKVMEAIDAQGPHQEISVRTLLKPGEFKTKFKELSKALEEEFKPLKKDEVPKPFPVQYYRLDSGQNAISIWNNFLDARLTYFLIYLEERDSGGESVYLTFRPDAIRFKEHGRDLERIERVLKKTFGIDELYKNEKEIKSLLEQLV
jgi:hypothetical protein